MAFFIFYFRLAAGILGLQGGVTANGRRSAQGFRREMREPRKLRKDPAPSRRRLENAPNGHLISYLSDVATHGSAPEPNRAGHIGWLTDIKTLEEQRPMIQAAKASGACRGQSGGVRPKSFDAFKRNHCIYSSLMSA